MAPLPEAPSRDFPSSPDRATNATTAQVIAAALQRHGVDTVFGQSIPTQIHLAAPEFGIRQIGYRTESSGAIMADGYARISHRIGVVTAQNGPAATLLVPGLAEALKSSIPILALVQDIKRADTDRNAFQELDHIELFRACSKWVRRVTMAERVEDYVDMAVAAATGGRPGPAVLLCPYDLLDEPASPSTGRVLSLGTYPLDRTLADPASVEAAADLLAAAERPLVVAGGGAHTAGAYDELTRLMDEAALPVATTQMGKGAVDEAHPLSLGNIGYFMGLRSMTKFHRPLIDAADVILLVGSRTNQSATDSWKVFPRDARFIHIDVDSQEIGRNYESLRLVGDAKLTLSALIDALGRRDLGRRAAARDELEASILQARRDHEREAASVCESDARPIRPERLMHDVDTLLTPETVVVTDASFVVAWVCNYLHARGAGARFLTPRGIAGLGWGLPLALGAKLARPESPVLCFAGDGGFGHSWSEMETARRMGLPVVLTVLNNQVLGYQKHYEDVVFGGHSDACAFAPVDHAAIARACGCHGLRIEDPADYLPAVKEAMAADRLTLIDVITDPEATPPIGLFG